MVFYTADKYEIKQLVHLSEERIADTIHPETAADVLLLGIK